MSSNSDSDDTSIYVGNDTVNRGSRKRKRSETKRQREKQARYTAADSNLDSWETPCKHKPNSLYKCGSIHIAVLQRAKSIVYQSNDKKEQDNRLANLMETSAPIYNVGKYKKSNKFRHKMVTNYYVRTTRMSYPVCQTFFMKLFEIGKRRVTTISKGKLKGTGVVDNRGGDRCTVRYSEKRDSVANFIKKLKVTESHYGRKKSRRLYLPAELSIRKLWRLHNGKRPDSLKVTYGLFRRIFVEDFNIGFRGPAVDMCSFCDRVSDEMKYERKLKNMNKVRDLKRDLKSHKFVARVYFQLMRNTPVGSVTLCFDLQQVHYLPKLTVGETFYKRQLSYYTFCVTDYQIKNPYFYSWLETEARRGSEEISSALIHYLNAHKRTWPKNTRKLRLFCDGCAGQNKNQHVMHSLSLWLAKQAPRNLDKINVFFPVRGHSFLPADRLFGLVEQKLKKMPEILLPEEYVDVYSEFGTVRQLNKDWNVRNYKTLNDYMKPFTGIKDSKKIVLKRVGEVGSVDVKVGMKLLTSFNIPDKTAKLVAVTKPKVKLSDIATPEILEDSIPLDLNKQKDIESLLRTRFGTDWPNRDDIGLFYRRLILTSEIESEESTDFVASQPLSQHSNPDEICDCLSEDSCSH